MAEREVLYWSLLQKISETHKGVTASQTSLQTCCTNHDEINHDAEIPNDKTNMQL